MPGIEKIKSLSSSILNSFCLKKKIALVIGGNKGLGQAMALALAGAGADMCVVGRGPDGLSETAKAVNSLGQKGIFFTADVTSEKQVEDMVNFVMSKFGNIDILVNSQGTNYLQEAVEFETAQWQKVMDVNVKSVFLCCKHVGKVMLNNKKGKIINVSSVRGFQGRLKDLAYAPSKGAVNQLTRSLAIEWGSQGINVNAIAPAFTPTAISETFLRDKKNYSWAINRIPMKRLGKPEDILGSVIFLASDASDFVSGHILVVDGGWLAA